eukprot:447945-Rhodomonas_salina.2
MSTLVPGIAVCGTELVYGATHCVVLSWVYLYQGSRRSSPPTPYCLVGPAYRPTDALCGVRTSASSRCNIQNSLMKRYAVTRNVASSTELGCAAISYSTLLPLLRLRLDTLPPIGIPYLLRDVCYCGSICCYLLSGTRVAYTAKSNTRKHNRSTICTRNALRCYALAGTDAGYAATRLGRTLTCMRCWIRRCEAGCMRVARYPLPTRCPAGEGLRIDLLKLAEECRVSPYAPALHCPRMEISLRACSAMAGTCLAYGSIGLRSRCAMSSTDIARCFVPGYPGGGREYQNATESG